MKFSNLGKKPLLGVKQNWKHPLSRGLIGHWIFNEGGGPNVKNLASRNTDGVIQIFSSPWRIGKFSKTLEFISSYITVPYNTILSPSFQTVSAWVYVASSAGDQVIVNNGANGLVYSAYCLKVGVCDGGGTAGFISYSVRSSSVPTAFTVTQTTGVALNVWTHVVCTNDGTTLNMYINGVFNATASATSSYDTASPLRIGGDATTGETGVRYLFSGSIDDVRVYNRALSYQEVQKFYTTPFADVQIPKKSWYNLVTSGNVAFSRRAPYMTGVLSIKG